MNETLAIRIAWPAPPFCRYAADALARDALRCRVELADGTVAEGDMLAFDPHAGQLEVREASGAAVRSLAFGQVARVVLAGHVSLLPDAEALEAVGAAPERAGEERTFTIRLRIGAAYKGRTRGFVKDGGGIFLFPAEPSGASPARWFVPATSLEDVQIGPLIGEAIAARTALSRPTLDAALVKQAVLREQRLGQYLNDRAIVTREELAHALERQREQPTARLGELLLDAGLITREQLDQALEVQSVNRQRRLGEILVDQGAVSRHQIQGALADKLGIPLINVRDFRIDPEVLKLVKPAFARRHGVLALVRSGSSLVVAVENPLSHDFVQPLRFATGLAVVPVMADPDDLRLRIAREYAALENRAAPFSWADQDAPSLPAGDSASRADKPEQKVEDLAHQLSLESPRALELLPPGENEARINDSTLVKLVNTMILDAHVQGASDIHVESNPGRRNLRVRFRVDGRLRDYLELEPAYCSALVSRIKIMASMDISERRRAQDGKIDFARFGPLPIELRVAIIPTANGLEDIVLRILAAAEPIPMDGLALSARNLAALESMVKRSYGLILVCGPTGSGKTTTLHSVLGRINHPDVKIWTAEDPIEITQQGVRQVQMNPKIGWTFAAAMRAFLRADPDVIMVGEMRDEETSKIGIEASLTGHLVLSTLHTNSAAESIVRLLDLGMDPFNFADALIGILSQRLARRLCPKCRQPREATTEEIDELAQEYCVETPLDPLVVATRWREVHGRDGRILLHEARGCEHCSDGYKGRIGIHELLVAGPRIKQLIHARATAPQLSEAAQREGMVLLKQDALEKVLAGHLDLASARAAAS